MVCEPTESILVQVRKITRQEFVHIISNNEAVTLFLLLLPHLSYMIYHTLKADPPVSIRNLKQRTDSIEIHQSETKALVEKCPPPCFVTLELFLWCRGCREFIVRCTKQSPLFP